MHDVAVALHRKSLGHFYAAGLGNTADVVARKINQHDVLGSLLGIGHQLFFGRFVHLGRVATGTCAGQRTNRHLFAVGRSLLAHQNLGAGPHHMEITEMVEVHVRAGVERAQRAVQAQRRGCETLVNALAHLHLHEVACGNQLLGLLHRIQIVLLVKAALCGVALASANLRCADRIAQLILELTQTLFGTGIGFGLARVGIDDEVELAREVVDDGHFFALQQHDVGRAKRIRRAAALELLLDVAHGVIAEVAGQTTAKARHTGRDRDLEALLIGSNKVQRVATDGLDHGSIRHDFGFGFSAKARGSYKAAGGQADKAVAAKALTTDDGFQQEAVLAIAIGMGELEVERERGFEVGKGLGQQGDAVIALGRKRFEFQFRDHGRSSGSQGAWHTCWGCVSKAGEARVLGEMRRFIPVGL